MDVYTFYSDIILIIIIITRVCIGWVCVSVRVSWDVSGLLAHTVGVTSGSPSHPSVWHHLEATKMLKLLLAADTGFQGVCRAEKAGKCQDSCLFIKSSVSRNKDTLNMVNLQQRHLRKM